MYKAIDIAKWFLQKNNVEVMEHETAGDDYEVYERITHLKLQKLLYYAQGVFLAFYNEKLFSEDIVAWQHGPVISNVYEKFKKYKRSPIEISLEEEDIQKINEIENDSRTIQTLNLVYENFAIYTAWQLRQLTHEDNTPWDLTQKNKGLNVVIESELIRDYFLKKVVSD